MTPKQEAFVREYLVDLNATQAAIRAGYSQNTAGKIGHENVTKPEIASAIQAAMNDRAERTNITVDRVLAEYARIGLADIREVVQVTSEGVKILPSDQWRPQAAAAVAEVKEGTDGQLSVKMHSKLGALDKVAQHLGMLIERSEVGAPGDFDAIPDDELREEAQRLAKQAGIDAPKANGHA